MDKYPYFADKICINSTKTLIFVHFSSWRSNHHCITEREKQFPSLLYFLAFWKRIGSKNVIYFILLSSSTNLVIFVKVIFVIFDFENEKKAL